MKLNLTWPMVALFAVCMASIIVSHGFVPLSAPSVVSLASTTAGFVFAALKKEAEEENEAEKDKGKEEPPKTGAK